MDYGFIWRLAGIFCLFVFSVQAYGQIRYDKLEVGNELTDGVGMGLFVKPLPLPNGEWIVVDKVDNSVGVNNNHVGGINSTPTVSFTVKSKTQNSPLAAIAVTFLPNTTPLRYSNRKCEIGPSLFVDDLDTTESDLLYVCARAGASGKFQSFVSEAPNSKDKWVKDTFAPLAPHAQSLPDNIMFLEIYGNRDSGRLVHYMFFIRADGNPQSDSKYLKFVKDWLHTAGLEVKNYLNNKAAAIPAPASYVAVSAN